MTFVEWALLVAGLSMLVVGVVYYLVIFGVAVYLWVLWRRDTKRRRAK